MTNVQEMRTVFNNLPGMKQKVADNFVKKFVEAAEEDSKEDSVSARVFPIIEFITISPSLNICLV